MPELTERVALALAEAGAAVAVNYRERVRDATYVVDTIRNRGGRAEAFGGDISSGLSVADMVKQVEKRLARFIFSSTTRA